MMWHLLAVVACTYGRCTAQLSRHLLLLLVGLASKPKAWWNLPAWAA
jgi:hypothetical protein